MTIGKMPRRVALACLLVKSGKMLEKAIDPKDYTLATFYHRLERHQRLCKLVEECK